jgi:hypothetical protein
LEARRLKAEKQLASANAVLEALHEDGWAGNMMRSYDAHILRITIENEVRLSSKANPPNKSKVTLLVMNVVDVSHTGASTSLDDEEAGTGTVHCKRS